MLLSFQDRGVRPNGAAVSAEWKPKRRVVVTIGIDNYKHWPTLTNAVSDATEVASVLKTAGFVEVVPPYLNEAANKQALLRLIETQLPDKLEDDDDLVLFFAGHGTSNKKKVHNDVFNAGYIIPADASAPDLNEWSDYLPLGELLESVGTLPPRHVLLILDSCRSGVALGRMVEMSKGSPGDTATTRVSRMVITSADADQDASDAGPVPGHSLFTGILIRGLETGDADLDKDGLITDSELALYLKSQVKKVRGSLQTPASGQFLADNRGEMAFPKPDVALLAAHAGNSDQPALGALGSTRGPRRAVRQAIVIGCDQYQAGSSVHYAVADAKEVGKAFEYLGYQVGYAINPTRMELEEYLRRAANSASSSLGSLTLFYSGLGYSDQQGERYFALTDSEPQDIKTTGLSYEDVQRILMNSGAQQRVFFVDSEFPSKFGDASPPPEAKSPSALAPWTPSSGYRALLAGRLRQHSLETPLLGHGVFSYFLIRGLRGAAAGSDGVITFESLAEYVRQEVFVWTHRMETPVAITSDEAEDYPLGVVHLPVSLPPRIAPIDLRGPR